MNFTDNNKFLHPLPMQTSVEFNITANALCAEHTIESAATINKTGLTETLILTNSHGMVDIVKDCLNVSISPSRIVDRATMEFKCFAHYPLKIEVLEISGKVVSKTFLWADDSKDVDLSRLRAGLYQLRITDSARIEANVRFIKYHQ